VAAPYLSAGVEGLLDEAVVGRLASEAGFALAGVYGRRGREQLMSRLSSYNRAARQFPWIVLIDLDSDTCAPDVLAQWLPQPAPLMRFRIAVREVEAWLLGDRQRLGAFLSVPPAMIAPDPEALPDAKEHMLSLARRSRSASIRRRMIPPLPLAGTGPAYTATLIEFVSRGWRPGVAARTVDSLARARAALADLRNRT
jgi:hypothetical protein